MTNENKIVQSIAEIEVGTRTGDTDRVRQGWAAVEDVLLTLNAFRAKEYDLLAELDKTRLKMWEACRYYMPLNARQLISEAMTVHQNIIGALAKNRKG